VLLLTRNLKFKVGKLIPKFIGLFKIFKYIEESAYKLELLSLYNRFYLTFYISLLEEYMFKRGQEPYLYTSKELPELVDDDKE
jgi:hypothetical protein